MPVELKIKSHLPSKAFATDPAMPKKRSGEGEERDLIEGLLSKQDV